jgi:hypothetical protein
MPTLAGKMARAAPSGLGVWVWVWILVWLDELQLLQAKVQQRWWEGKG